MFLRVLCVFAENICCQVSGRSHKYLFFHMSPLTKLDIASGCFFFVGGMLPGELRPHHKSVFDFDEVCGCCKG